MRTRPLHGDSTTACKCGVSAFPHQLVGGQRDWTAFEKEQQLMKDRGTKAQALVLLNLDGYLFSDKWKSGYQAQIRRRLAADFTESGTDGEV
jgi:hypothetical protein